MSFAPDPYDVDVALQELHRRGFTTTARGRISASIRGTREQFEKVFGTKLTRFQLDPEQDYQFHTFYYPSDDAPWNPDPSVASPIDDAYIQWPHVYMAPRTAMRRPTPTQRADASATPPDVNSWHHEVPGDLERLSNATPVHRAGTLGTSIRVVMIDTGFFHSHPFFPDVWQVPNSFVYN